MARILIAGCGDLGSHLGVLLAHDGHQIWGLKRDPATLPAEIRPVQADLTDPASLVDLPAELDYVFYTAAAGGRDRSRYQAAYVDGVARLLTALSESGQDIKRIFFSSSTSVYGQHQGEWVDETSPTEPAAFSGQLMCQGEALFRDGPYPSTVVRFGGIYGPGRTQLIDSVRRGGATCTSEPMLYTNRIHRDDCANVFRHLLSLRDPESLYVAIDDHPAPQCEVLTWLAGQLGVSPPQPVRAVEPPTNNKRCSNQRLRATGFRFRYPSYREGYRTLLSSL